jgi:hypothetical protein
VAPHGILLDRLASVNFQPTGLGGITAAQQRMALIVWAFALALPDMMPTKPILLIEGVKGAGKTSAIVFLQLMLQGVKRPMMLQRNKEDDFAVILLRSSPIALFDNTDSYIDWVPDAVANYATGGVVSKRKLYSDDESLTIRPHTFIAVATRNPASFRRDDVADRCVILRLDRRPNFTPTAHLERAITDDRALLLGEYMWFIGKIVEELRRDQTVVLNETHRMADFAALARVVGRVVGWPDEEVSKLMLALQGERDAFINEEDPLVDLMHRWLAYRQRNGRSNVGRQLTAMELHTELEMLARAAGQNEWKESPRTLGMKLRSGNIETEFRIDQTVVDKHKMFRIWRRSDAALTVVDEELEVLG